MHFKFTAIFVLFMFADALQQFVNDTSETEIEVTTTTPKPRSHVLVELGIDTEIVYVLLPKTHSIQAVCYPKTHRQNMEASTLIHVLCKQLGHVTFDLMYKRTFTTPQRTLLPNSAQCTGREDGVSECPWENVKNRRCTDVLATHCSTCNYKYYTSHGAIHNPGFPYTYLYSLICEWMIQIPIDQGIELEFEKFVLPRTEKDDCDSYVELTYGEQNSLIHDRLCAADKVSSMTIPFKSVRIRFVSGVYRQAYGRERAHYGLHIIYTNVPLGVSSNSITNISVVTGGVFLIIVGAMCCYLCQSYVVGNKRSNVENHARHCLPPNAPTTEEIQEAYDFRRCSLHAPREEKQKGSLDFTIFQSDNSSTDSCITRWKSESNLPVTAALAPVGPDGRTISIATTPRSVFPESCRKWSKESAQRIEKVRTKLVARFSSSSTHNTSDVSVFLPSSDRRTYSRLSCEDDIPLQTIEAKENRSNSASSSKVPNIIVEFVN